MAVRWTISHTSSLRRCSQIAALQLKALYKTNAIHKQSLRCTIRTYLEALSEINTTLDR